MWGLFIGVSYRTCAHAHVHRDRRVLFFMLAGDDLRTANWVICLLGAVSGAFFGREGCRGDLEIVRIDFEMLVHLFLDACRDLSSHLEQVNSLAMAGDVDVQAQVDLLFNEKVDGAQGPVIVVHEHTTEPQELADLLVHGQMSDVTCATSDGKHNVA